MSFESGYTRKEQSKDTVDNLLARLPEKLQEVWERKLDGLPETEQVSLLRTVLNSRAHGVQAYHEPKLLPEGVEIFKTFPDDVKQNIELLRESPRKLEIGYGKAGHVIADPAQAGVCYKILFDNEKLPLGTNDIALETELQHEISDQLDNYAGVRVPKVFAFISEQGTRAITMELLDAPSLRRITERGEERFPDTFDETTFFKALEKFISRMHELGYHHRDLHAGNVLVDRTTGMPCVIDFGLSTRPKADEKDTYREKVIESGHFKEIMLQWDSVNIDQLKRQVKKYLHERNQGVL